MSQMTVSGAVSGLDTASMINQLVAVQSNQQTLLKSQQSAVQTRADAYTALTTSLTSLGTLATDLAKTSAWSGSTATASSTSVTASATGTASGALTFDVTSVAAAHTIISTSALSATGDIAASGPLTLTSGDGTATTIDVGTGSLQDVISAINAAGKGLTATAVRTEPGAFRLQVTSSSTGAASAFTLDGLDGFDGTAVLTQGSDATISVGANPESAYTVTSTTNTFADLVPGVSFTVTKPESGVTVSAKVDGSAVADKVSKLVDAVNGILTNIAAKSAYSTSTKTGGPFTGESTVRSLQQNLLSAVSLVGAPGVSLTKDGQLSFNRDTFLTAFSADPAKVARAFGGASSFTVANGSAASNVSVSNALTSARAGTYAVHVDAPAVREQWELTADGDLTGRALTVTQGQTIVSYTPGSGETLATVAAAFNSRAAAAGIGVTATVSNLGLILTAAAAGSGGAFTPSFDGAPATRLAAGTDISGTIDGRQAVGVGSVLSLPTGSGGAVGLSLAVSTTADDLAATGGDVGSLTFTPGLAQRLSTLVADATGSSGSVTSAEDGATAEVKRYQDQIDTWDARLTAYRQTLTTQFTAMETALATLKSASSALTQLTGASSSTSSASTSGG